MSRRNAAGAAVQALDGVLVAAGRGPVTSEEIEIEGPEPALPSNFRLGVAGAAAIGAVGVAANDLWELRHGRRQKLAIDMRAAALALRADRYLRVDGAQPPSPWSPISGFYQGADGKWIQLHCNFPHHRHGMLRLLGCDDRQEAVAAEIAKRDAAELERDAAAAGLCAALVRTRDAWRAHPQGRAVAASALVDIRRIADAPIEPLEARDRPLSGLRVLDLTRVIAGPVCGRTLAEHGATVMRIAAPHLPFVGSLVMDTGHGKLSAYLDLDTPEGQAQLQSLVRGADIFSQSYRPGALAARGFGPGRLARIRPGIVCVELSAYGQTGPWGGRRGYDTLVQCSTGLVAEHSLGRKQPVHLPAQALDYLTGYLAAFGAMEALRRRALEGGSWLVRISLARTADWLFGLGRIEGADARGRPAPELAEVLDLMTETDTPFGRLLHFAPVMRMSETPPRWARPAVPLGSHPPEWPWRDGSRA